MRPEVRTAGYALFAALAATLVLPSIARAQSGGEGFLFRRPVLSIGVRAGYALPRAGSDIFDFTTEQLTVDRGDFQSGYFGGEIGARIADRLDLVLGAGHAGTVTDSEFRDWVDQDDLPIEQTTEFSVTPITLSARYYLVDRGRSVGRLAWIPTRFAPYVGGGVGWILYRFEQNGDFVDFETLDVFRDNFYEDGRANQLHALGGVEMSLSNHLVLSGEARYQWAKGPLAGDFVDFDDMDLAGLQFTVGLLARF